MFTYPSIVFFKPFWDVCIIVNVLGGASQCPFVLSYYVTRVDCKIIQIGYFTASVHNYKLCRVITSQGPALWPRLRATHLTILFYTPPPRPGEMETSHPRLVPRSHVPPQNNIFPRSIVR